MTKTQKICAMAFVVCSGFLFGYVSSFSNFLGLYPSFDSKTTRPRKPYSKDQYLMEKYRKEVKQYVEDANDYVTASNNDLESINRESKLAIENANEVVHEYNRFVKSGY